MKTPRLLLSLLTAIALVAGSVLPASAKTFKLPEKKPVFSVTYPDNWEPEETDDGVQGQTKDTAVYLSVEATRSEKGMNAIIDASFAMFKEHKVEIDRNSKKTNKMKIAGADAEEMLFTGRDEDGPTVISITVFSLGDSVVIVSYWASIAAEAKYHPAIVKIIGSIKMLEQ